MAEICIRLDGLPLALELAAAGLNLFTPGELTFRLRHRMRLLTSGARDLSGRHRTLRAALAWSHDLLGPDERALFRRSSVFVGGWSLDAAATGRRGARRGEQHYLARREEPDPAPRPPRHHRVHDAREPARVRGRTARGTGRGGRDAQPALPVLRDGRGADRVADGHGCRDRVGGRRCRRSRPTCARPSSSRRPPAKTTWYSPLTGALGWFCYTRGHLGEGLTTVRRALAMVGDDPVRPPVQLMASVLQLDGVLSFARGDLDRVEECLDPSSRSGTGVTAAMSSAFRGLWPGPRGSHGRCRSPRSRQGAVRGAGQCRRRRLVPLRPGPASGAATTPRRQPSTLREALTRFRDSGYPMGDRVRYVGHGDGGAAPGPGGRGGRAGDRGAGPVRRPWPTAAASPSASRPRPASLANAPKPRSAGQLLGAAATLRERLAAPLPDEDRGQHHAVTQLVPRALGPNGADAARRGRARTLHGRGARSGASHRPADRRARRGGRRAAGGAGEPAHAPGTAGGGPDRALDAPTGRSAGRWASRRRPPRCTCTTSSASSARAAGARSRRGWGRGAGPADLA